MENQNVKTEVGVMSPKEILRQQMLKDGKNEVAVTAPTEREIEANRQLAIVAPTSIEEFNDENGIIRKSLLGIKGLSIEVDGMPITDEDDRIDVLRMAMRHTVINFFGKTKLKGLPKITINGCTISTKTFPKVAEKNGVLLETPSEYCIRNASKLYAVYHGALIVASDIPTLGKIK